MNLSLKFSKNSSGSGFGSVLRKFEISEMQKCKALGFDEIVHHQMSRSNGSRLPDPDQACFTSILYRFRWSTAVSISGNRGKIRVSSVYHATFVEGMQVTWNGRKSVRIHRGFSSLLSTQPARNTARDDLSLTNHPIAQISWRFLLSFASSSLSVRGNLFRNSWYV